jgi:putative nucleotidyltransferase with HDIG domain
MAYIERRRPDVGNVTWAHFRIAPFPQVAIRVLQLANKENVHLHQFSDLISSDPAFASEVLAVANSLRFAPRFPSSTILQAIAVLGIGNLQGICLTVGARAYMGKALNLTFTKALWRHNLACALVAERLAAAGFMDSDVAYTSGVLHDIGRLALATIRPNEYSALLDQYSGSAESLLQAERDRFGLDHCGVGHLLLENWKLPSEFEAVIADHHSARRPDSAWGMAELIKVSCKLADATGFAAFPACQATSLSDLMDELPRRERKHFEPQIETLADTLETRIQALEAI